MTRIGRRQLLSSALVMAGGTLMPPSLSAALPPDGEIIGALAHHVTRENETLLDVARRHDLGVLEISAANPGVDVWVPGLERPILLPAAHILPEAQRQGIVINLAELRLYHFEGGGLVRSHAIGIGREGFTTPLGKTSIVRKQRDPTWRPTASAREDDPDLPAVVPPGPENPLGNRALYLGFPTYLIHGTHKPLGVGRRVSRGCIRLYPERVEALFERVPVGTPVEIVDQPLKLGRAGEHWFLEAHPTRAQLDELEARYRFEPRPPDDATAPDEVMQWIEQRTGDDAMRLAWNLIEAELLARRGVPVRITRSSAQTSGAVKGWSAIDLDPGLTGLY